jgi:hypothetical protein
MRLTVPIASRASWAGAGPAARPAKNIAAMIINCRKMRQRSFADMFSSQRVKP